MTLVKINTSFFTDELNKKTTAALPAAKTKLKELASQTCVGSEWTGWWDYPNKKGFSLVNEIKEWKSRLDVEYDMVLVIGIGGSYLGTRAVSTALSSEFPSCNTNSKHVLMAFAGHHMSESGLSDVLELMRHRNPIVNMISKSGTTTEPGVAFRIIRSLLEQKYGKDEATKRIIATTDPEKGALHQLSKASGYKMFEVPSDIGGRYSVLSAVGLVPLALAGYDIEALMNGANQMFGEMKKDDTHPVLQYAASRFIAHTTANKQIELLSYSEPKLNLFVEWWRQLFGESEGKQGRGIFPAGMCITTDLHSLGQYAQDGTRNLFETFLVFEQVKKNIQIPVCDNNLDELKYLEGTYVEDVNKAAMTATKLAHYDGKVPCLELAVNSELNESAIGALFAFFETACAVSGSLLELNPFDQPGVEDYKKNMFALLGKPGFEDLRKKLKQ